MKFPAIECIQKPEKELNIGSKWHINPMSDDVELVDYWKRLTFI